MKATKIAFTGIPVTDTKRARMAVVQDPDGNKIIIHKLKLDNEKGPSS